MQNIFNVIRDVSLFAQNGLEPRVVVNDSDRVVSHGVRRRAILEMAQAVRVGWRSAEVRALDGLQAAAAVLPGAAREAVSPAAGGSREAVPAAVGRAREAVLAGPPEAVQTGPLRAAQSGVHAGRGFAAGTYAAVALFRVPPRGRLGNIERTRPSLYISCPCFFQYVAYKAKIPDLKEFTLCHWHNIFNYTHDQPIFSYSGKYASYISNYK